MDQSNPFSGRTVAWAVPVDETTGEPVLQDWSLSAVEAMRSAGASVEVIGVRAAAADAVMTAVERADLVLATSMAIGAALHSAGLERFRLWTFLQGGPGRALHVTDESEESIRQAVAVSRKILVFDEDARSTIEGAVDRAAGQVVLFPAASGTGATGFRAAAEGTTALVVNLELTGPLGLEAIKLHAERMRPEREVPPVFLVCGPEIQAELRIHPVYRQFAALPGARAVAPGDGALTEALRGHRPVGLLPKASPGQGHRVSQARLWFEERGIEVFAEAQALPALPRLAEGRRWRAETLTTDLQALQGRSGAAPVRTLAEELGHQLGAYLADYDAVPRQARPTRILLVGADFKFAGDLLEALAQRDDVELRVDLWETNGGPVPEDNAALLDWADVVLCEFASRNAVWYSHHVSPRQRLVLHLHGYELRQPPIHEIKIDAVETVVFASEFYREKALTATGWPREKTTVISNPVNTVDLARAKLDDARFHLGMAGYVPELKRPDRALDLLELLLEQDERYVLHLRGHSPWNYPFVWDRPLRRDAYLAFYERLRRDERLRQAVVFDPFGPDMGNWFRGIGWVLSPSTRETFHLAPVEGMASGAVPLVWRREGSEEIFPEQWNVDSARQAADLVLAAGGNAAAMDDLSVQAAGFAEQYDARAVTARWLRTLVEGPADGTGPASSAGEPVRTSPEDPAETDRWHEAASLAATGQLTLAAGLIGTLGGRPWTLGHGRRLLLGEVLGVPALRQRVHRLHASAPEVPLCRAQGELLVCGSSNRPHQATGSFGAPLVDTLTLTEALDDVNAIFDHWVDAICRRALASGADGIYALGDELTALACTVAASRLGLRTAWDLAADPDAHGRVLSAAADPDRATDRGAVALMAARHSGHCIGLDAAAVRTRWPIEDRVERPRLARRARIGVIGSGPAVGDLGTAMEPVRLDAARAEREIRAGLDGLVVAGTALDQAQWNDLVSGGTTVLDRVVTEARRYNIPIGLWCSGVPELEPHLDLARRVDAVLAPAAEDVARLHDRRIVPTQVATALPVSQPDGAVSRRPESLLSESEQLGLLLRMLRLAG